MKPIVGGLQASYGDRMAFLRLDAETNGRAAFTAYKLRGHPSYVIIDPAGKALWKSVGEQPRNHLQAAIRQALGEK